MKDLLVREAEAADVAQVIALERAAPEAPHWSEAEYDAILGSGGEDRSVRRCLLVAEADGLLVGFAVGRMVIGGAAGISDLESVVVDVRSRRKGAGRALCQAVIGWSRGWGAAEVQLEVRAGSVGAIGLYTGLGFEAVGRRAGYYRDPAEDAVLMRLEITAAK